MLISEVLENIGESLSAAFEIVYIRLRYNGSTISAHFRKKGATIGDHCLFDIHDLGAEPYLVSIGNHVFVAAGVLFHTHDGGAWITNQDDPDLWVFGKIVIEDNCLIGTRSHLLPNIRIGHDSVVGAGSVVISDVPPNSIVMGVPARVVGSSIKYKEKCHAIWKEQVPPGYSGMHGKQKAKALRKHLIDLYKKQEIPKSEKTGQ